MQAQQMVNILRRVRHDFANHLQVISGYLDLGCPEKAQAYIGALSKDLEAERICFAIPEGEASIYYYEQLLKARDLGIILHYEDIGIDSWEILREHDEPYRSLADLRKTGDTKDDQIVHLSLNENQSGVDLRFASSNWIGGPQSTKVNKE